MPSGAPASRRACSCAFDRVSRLHGFRVDEIHRPFGAEAFAQSGRALPTETRRATLDAQAILVGAANEPALEGVESELDLRARVDRVVFAPRGAVTGISPLGDAAAQWALEQAFDVARSSRASVTSVGGDADWRSLVESQAARHPGVLVEVLPMNTAVSGLAFDPGRFDVVVTPAPFAQPLAGPVP